MGSITITKQIDADPGTVFHAMSDFPTAADRIPNITNIEMLTDGPVGVGTRFRETRIVMKREATEEMEITAFEPGRAYAVECESCGSHYRTDVHVRPEGSGTFVEMTIHYRAVSFGAKLMSPLAPLMSGMMKKCIEKDLDQIKASLDGAAPAASPA